VAFCNDLGIPVTRGSAMLSVLLAFGFIGGHVRQAGVDLGLWVEAP